MQMSMLDRQRPGSTMLSEDEDEVEELADPFAQLHSPHPALEESFYVSPDIYEHLYDSFLDSEILDRWYHRKNSWQLHCIGGPGAGKVHLVCT